MAAAQDRRAVGGLSQAAVEARAGVWRKGESEVAEGTGGGVYLDAHEY